LDLIFVEVIGFEEFIVTIANSTLHDSVYGIACRVSIGALLSTIDAATDLYVITTYYESEELRLQANALIAMCSSSMFVSLLCALSQNNKKSGMVKLREALITLLFLRPAIDAYRVSTGHEDEDANFDVLIEMMMNKVCACEASCVRSEEQKKEKKEKKANRSDEYYLCAEEPTRSEATSNNYRRFAPSSSHCSLLPSFRSSSG